MADNTGKRSNNRCAIYGTSGAFGKPGYNDSLDKAKETVLKLIASGINTFVTDARDGFELEMSVYIQDLKKENPELHLVVAKPYPNFNTNWRTKPILQSVMNNADMVKYITEKEEDYSSELLDQWILNHCDTLIYITRTLSATINRLSSFDLSDKRIVFIPERPSNGYETGEASKAEEYPYNLIAEIQKKDPENIDLSEYPEDIEERLHAALEACLKDREVFILEERFIEKKKLHEIGNSLDLTRERIRQLINKSVRRLRYYNRYNNLFGETDNNEKDSTYAKGQKWIPEEETLLIDRVNQGLVIEEIASLHGRTIGGIRSRLRRLGYDPDNLESYHNEDNNDEIEKPSPADVVQDATSKGLNLNEIVIAAQQVPGRASFDNYYELKSYLRSGLQLYNSTTYSLDNIDQARRDHFVLKNVKKKLSDTKKAIQKEYSMPVETVIKQLDELIGMVNEPFRSLDRMLKMNAKEIKRLDIMSYAQSRAYVLGKYASSVIQSPAFFNPRWCNASYSETKWKREVDVIIRNAEESLDYILNSDVDDVGIVLGYYLDKLSLSGIDAFLQNVKREESHREPETVFIDINTGEIVEQVGETTAADYNENEGVRPDSAVDSASGEPKEVGCDIQGPTDEHKIIQKQVMLIGEQKRIEEFINTASQYGVEVESIE